MARFVCHSLRWAVAACGLLLIVAPLIGCGGSVDAPRPNDASQQPMAGGTLVIGASHDLRGINQLVGAHSSFSRSILDQMFLHLLEEQADYTEHPPTLLPQLADHYEWSDDHKTLTLYLRRDAVWSDGVPVSAEDVRWTWQAQTHEDVAWGYADMKEAIADIEVVDSHTVRVHFTETSTSQLTDLNEGAILPKHAWSKLPFREWRENADWFLRNLVVNGPFILKSWRPQEEIILHRNESYFRPGLPYLDRVVLRVIPEKSSQILQLLSGELDFVDHIPPVEAIRVEQAEDLQVIDYWHRQYDFICWNLANPLFADAQVRRALTMAIDRQSIIDTLLFGHAKLSTSPIISSVWAHNRQIEPWPYDPDDARSVLAGLGWRDSDSDGILDRDGRRFSFELSTNADSRLRVDAAVMIQEQLRKAGIEARVRQMEFNTLIDKNIAHEFDATIGAWGIDTSLDLSYAFHSDSIEDGYNFGMYSNSEVDRLIEEARTLSDLQRLAPIVREIQHHLHQDQPYTFLWEPRRLIGARNRLQHAQPNPLNSYFHLEEWWLSPPA